MINDIRFPTTSDIGVDGKYQPVSITSSDESVIKAPDVNNAARVDVIRPLPGKDAKDVTLTITITDKWYSSISIMQILCISGAFTPIAYLYQQLIISKGKSRIYMWNTIVLGIILLSGVLLVHSHGIYAMLAVYVSTNILWLLTWHYFVWQEIGLKLRHALIDILPYAVIAATVMVITYYSTRSIENIYLRLASKIVLAAALYIAAMWGSRSVTFKESIQYFIKKKPHEP